MATMNRHPTLVARGLLWAVAALAAGPGPAAAETTCPPPPSTLAELIATDVDEARPLSDQYPRGVWPYPEHAASCLGATDIEVDVFVGSPEGIGGSSAFLIEPRWVMEPRFVAVDDSTTDPADEGQFFPVAVPPRLDAAFVAFEGRWARISGHFHDPIAETCVVADGEPPDAPAPAVAVRICETAFVLTSIRDLAASPGTHTAPSAESHGQDAGRMSPWWFVIVALATLGAGAWHLDRRSR